MILIYITCESLLQAKEISKALLEQKLCACTNILPQMNSMYFWPPKSNTIESLEEVVLIVKTVEKMFKKIEEEIKKLHSYEVPCIFSIPVSEVSQNYLSWLKGEISE